ncbi:tRNA (5-methylaminomethyl-2-thiouridine)(34)-methyltransferase MnmD [Aquisalinus flavus]|uniref:tRNA 5-methylaminomethyl-2-thiouridine biosynthesis bifunctional protein MnmC n=1 Tax=Aquisalinus flavus TaxID=1526572 RepID=A0A8J2Y304_9PROT|nr:tRNA (5-methylaminomethyl-2-thiouridine)(34)-methyltransferase MnmD [Aquisalinus flavus]MBD0426953.1 tRNA (5-methylaminomethyl-2-thiouridine)(34)-methyltransferase MnmD [Aquisalinus flavus]UNE46792.1 tRNA (5-methylaminomethyl-2-thiouridine)(34)-methyltransferase MnmD [Aquisalinus flavus]GGC97210.1 tRNA 5-methylaminomethyl-2-thiouridine biosynthesis bifunctional protein MnmC [Aquisalinus flavus]
MTDQGKAPPFSETLPTADLDWSAGDAVRSAAFGDVYFSDRGGLEETQHVFLAGNDLSARFAALDEGGIFTIAETGFGTGLNILAAWQAWDDRGHGKGNLHVFSVEGFPLTAADFGAAQDRVGRCWPMLAPYAERLAVAYPALTPGVHTIYLAPDVTLTLALGEAGTMLAEADFRADAWFLDGFSPALNEDMWRDDIFAAIGRLSAPGTTAATFTVAGTVRRRLQANGFEIEKRPGFGRKREMLTAIRPDTEDLQDDKDRAGRRDEPAPWFSLRQLHRPAIEEPVHIAGAGIAGASLAWTLRRAGRKVAIHDPAGMAAGASGNPAGLIMPRLDLGDTPARHFYRQAYLHTVRLIEQLEKETGTDIFASRGGLMLALSPEDTDRHRALAASGILPAGWLELVDSGRARQIAATDMTLPDDALHLYLPQAGTIRPPRFVAALLRDVDIAGEPAPETAGVIIEAKGSSAIVPGDGHLAASLGQIDRLDMPPPACAITFGNYIAPLGGGVVTGATYDKAPAGYGKLPAPEPDASRSRRNIDAASMVMPAIASAPLTDARAAWRCVTADRHPVAGPLPDLAEFLADYDELRTGMKGPYPPATWRKGAFTLTGLGSRGLVTAPLCAAMISAMITNAPMPVSPAVVAMLSAARFVVRDLKRNAG